MRTLGVLACGWILGGLVVVSLGHGAPASSRPPARVAAVDGGGTAGETPALRDAAFGDIAIPVLGISASDLRDSYTEPRGGGRVHRAIDIRAPRGTPVIAAVDGTVRKLFTSAAGGVTIYQFDAKEERVFYYAHLDRYADGLAEGLFVREGTVIGYVGTTGNAPADTPHLHFSIEVLPPTKEWWKGEPVNPFPLLTRRASALP